jgi:hypothetical protein
MRTLRPSEDRLVIYVERKFTGDAVPRSSGGKVEAKANAHSTDGHPMPRAKMLLVDFARQHCMAPPWISSRVAQRNAARLPNGRDV